MLREESSLKMGLLIFPEHTGNTNICVGTVKIAIYSIAFLFSLQKFLANLELFKITDLQNIGKGVLFPRICSDKHKVPNCSKPFSGETEMLLG